MTTWYVQDGSDRRTLSERSLRFDLRYNNLKGTELARPDDATEWKPLHDYPLFAEEVPHTGPPAVAAHKRSLMSYAVHLAIFVVVMCVLGFPTWLIVVWGFFLLLHSIRSVPSAVGLWRSWRGLPAPAVAEASPPSAQERDRFLRDVERAMEALMAAYREDPDRDAADEPELARIHEVASRLQRQREALLAAVDEPTHLALRDELEAARAAAQRADDERSRDAFEAEARAVAERLAAMEAALTAAARIEARQKTLLHQLEGLRLALLRSAAEEAADPPDLAGRIATIHDELEAEAEVEAELARARRARQPTGS